MPVRPFFSSKPNKNVYDWWDKTAQRWTKCSGFTIDVRDPISGERVQRRIKDDSKTAKLVEKEILKVQQSGGEITTLIKKNSVKTINDLFTKYRRYVESLPVESEEKIAKRSLDRAGVAVKGLVNSVGNIYLKNIGKKTIRDYINERLHSVRSTTVNTDVRHLSVMFNRGIREGLIDNNPFKGIKYLKEDVKEKRVLSPYEWQKLLKAADSNIEIKALLLTYIFTGARRSEILKPKLSWKDIDFENEIIHLRYRKRGKHSKVPMGIMLREVLLELQKQSTDEYPFPFSGNVAYRLIHKLYLKAEITIKQDDYDNLNVHSLRKSFGSFLINIGVPIYDVKELLAHSSTTTTEKHYTKQAEERKREFIDKLDRYLSKNVNQNVNQTVLKGTNQYQNDFDVDELIELLKDYKNKKLLELEISSGAGTRTPDTRIMIPLL